MEKIIENGQATYRYSPSDMILYMRSPFATWMERFKVEQPAEANKILLDDDPMMTLLANKGTLHEQNYLSALKAQYGDDQVVIIDRSKGQAEQDTLDAIRKGYKVIYQGFLSRDNFIGYIDFLIRHEGHSALGDYYYQPCDTKLTKTVRPYFLMQLCAYSWILEAAQGRLPDECSLVLGNQEVETFRIQQFYAYFHYLKDDFLSFQGNFSVSQCPDPAFCTDFGRWETYAKALLNEMDSLALVANIRKSQIKKLNRAGINTLSALVETEKSYISGVSEGTFSKLKAQAKIQKQSKGKDIPNFEVIEHDNGKGLSALPPASRLDVYFDIEGHPLVDGGLEYLWAVSYIDADAPKGKQHAYKDWWAHTEEQEKHAFELFIDWVYERWQQDNKMHIYHYASYEVSAIRRISNRYNTKTDKVDELLRNNVFVDLYKIVKNGLLIGEPSYSLKNIEHLYRGKRETAVASGDESIVFYEKWRESGGVEKWCQDEKGYASWLSADSFNWNNWPELMQIREYNIDDCESTLELVDWLRNQASEYHIQYVDPNADIEEQERTEAQEKYSEKKAALQARQQALLKHFQDAAQLHDDPKAHLLKDLIEYFIRESKAKAWEYFDRLEKSHAELFDDECVIVDIKAIHRYEENGKMIVECDFDDTQPIRKDKFKAATVLEHDLKVDALKFEAKEDKTILILTMRGSEANKLPEAFAILGKDPFIDTAKLEYKICNVAEKYFNESKVAGPLEAILSQSSPVFQGSQSLLPITRSLYPENETYINAIIDAVKNMDNTCLCIQGPPGAGKTYTAEHVIKALLAEGKRVGILSNSHAAIMNLMEPLLTEPVNIVKVGGFGNNQAEFQEKYPKEQYANFTYRTSFDFTKKQPYSIFQLVGATAYALCDDEAWSNPLDYLFIDEASQVSLAHLVGVSSAARNIILMGDQMQLEQPTQGAHPGKAGLSCLQYFLGDHAVVPEELGIFLERTFRMHPAVCEPLSKVVYEGKLVSDAATQNQAIVIPKPEAIHQQNGVIWLPLAHEGNTQCSQEEVEHIKKLIKELLTGTFQDKHHQTLPMTENDILVVAPYNMQVNLLKEQLPEGIRIGTIDKFQGQEAPVVIISMGVSDVNDSSRGLDFVFDINRLNVAVSRAKALAIIVSNLDLYKCQVNSILQLKKASFFSTLVNS